MGLDEGVSVGEEGQGTGCKTRRLRHADTSALSLKLQDGTVSCMKGPEDACHVVETCILAFDRRLL